MKEKFLQPQSFGEKYLNSDTKKTKKIMGSIRRFWSLKK